ncbi:FHA domain-containing protein [Fimbriimonas ginsengisoli Gsoil 348]|uniref:FHA domain-containing protein n=1 Tax=Fimbriimonas ginsengisoli Gsoil 348 TaxID=661478 RepID=A0A068NNZ2_FIMGI|nr:FHA domain-containing protein [Fimbriimonas ginsengisoli Gsoil 348]
MTGAFAGVATWLVSEPFTHTAREHGTHMGLHSFSLGSFYGWFAHMMLGALIAGSLALVISLQRTGWRRALAAGAVGMLVGGALTCGADALSDWIGIQMVRGRSGLLPNPGDQLAPVIWHISVSLALAFSVTIAAQPTAARFRRALAAAVVAAVVGYMIRQAIAPLEAVNQVSQIDLSNFDPKNPDAMMAQISKEAMASAWQPWSIMRLAEWMTMGIVMGLALSLSDIFLRTASLRLDLGRGEGRTYPLDNGPNRIGTAEGLEVRLPFQHGTAPIHAIIDPRQGHWAITDLTGQGLTVNGYPAREALLREGDVVGVGPYFLRLVLGREGRTMSYDPTEHEVVLIDNPQPIAEASLDHRLIDPFGKVIPLSLGSWVVGRGEGAQIRLDYDGRVSRQHALLEVLPNGASLQDLGGANGTSVNGDRLTRSVSLKDGDRVTVGGTTLQYRS